MIRSSELARVETIIRFSLCALVNSDSRVTPVIPMIPFIGVLISCDMFAKNSDLLLFANSAASLAAVFFCNDSRREKTIWLIFVFKESISPEASTVTKELKSPSVAAAEICAKARTCEVRLRAMVLTLEVISSQVPVMLSTLAVTPKFPLVPTSRATRVTSVAKTES